MSDEREPRQFVPAPGQVHVLDRAQWREVARDARPDWSDAEFDEAMAHFLAMQQRVENPRRRLGGDVRRRGPVLFDPAQYTRRQLMDGEGQ